MSPILDLQRRLVEVGRVRMGAKTDKGHPKKLDDWRLTSHDSQRLEAAAELFGGKVQPWAEHEGQFELYTEASELDIVLPPGQTLSQWYELWSGGGCKRRCDGEREQLSDGPCLCPADYTERRELATDGRACKPTTRLSVILPRVPGVGVWRVESHGYYAAVELAGVAGLLEEITRRGQLLPARLRVETRRQIQGGQTKVFPVPVIDIDASLWQVREAIEQTGEGEIVAGYTPIAALAESNGPTVAEAIEQIAEPSTRTRANAAEPIGASGPEPDPSPIDGPSSEPAETVAAIIIDPVELDEKVSEATRKGIFARARALGLSHDDVADVVEKMIGQPSTAELQVSQLEDLDNLLVERARGAK